MTTLKARTNPVTTGVRNVAAGRTGPSVETVDSLDGTEIVATRHYDGDVSVYVGRVEGVMTREQAREFFTKALELCEA